MAHEKQVDFVALFALEKELRAFLRHLGEYQAVHTDITSYRATIVLPGRQSYRLIALGLPDMGNYMAATATTRAIDVWNPRFVLLGGIAGGAKRPGVQLGDLVVADLIVGYEPGKQKAEGVERRLKIIRPAEALVQAAKELPPENWALSMQVPRTDGQAGRILPLVHFGVVLSGEKVIASDEWMRTVSTDVAQMIPTDPTRIAAVEMEAYGTAMAAYQAPSAPGMFMAKAICDWADESKNDGWQEYAADVSASFLVALLRRGPVPPSIGPKEQATRRDVKPYSGRSKLGLCKRMGDKWEDLADYYDVPLDERRTFRRGRECQDIWNWLENRKKLGSLADALGHIDRDDLIEELIPADSN